MPGHVRHGVVQYTAEPSDVAGLISSGSHEGGKLTHRDRVASDKELRQIHAVLRVSMSRLPTS